ncbi:MAG: bleomycin resistance protein [Paracoccus denitrificans]|uniref:Bleomycin resistance protein n=1 Tax=Paracoccus denitrificans TaxID=266 RepID=A0A533HVQ1_PARDE|nr:MAG: bleomycin resistance protein [Paracoccus denitrificans]
MIVTANLPSRDFDATETFYADLGFTRSWRDADWMILIRDGTQIEFFRHPELKAEESWFSACIRTDELDALLAEYSRLDLPAGGIPRLHPGVQRITDDLRMFAVVDPDGSLIRCLGP